MNKEEYEKMSTFDKIDYDVQMDLYMKYNNTIATMNDHLGEMYSYSDVKEVEDAEKQDELTLYKKALKEKCDCLDKAIELLGNYKHYCVPDELSNSENEDLVDKAYEILKGCDE